MMRTSWLPAHFEITRFVEKDGVKMAVVVTQKRVFRHNTEPEAGIPDQPLSDRPWSQAIPVEELIQLGQKCKDHEMGLAHDLTEEEKRVEMERMKRAEEEEDEEEYRQSLDEPDFEFEDSFYGEQK